MSQPVLLDLYCNAGGATRGFQEAGFRVVGVDREDQPNYVGDDFLRADALALLTDRAEWIRRTFAFVHGSPPCQHSAAITKGTNKHRQHLHPNLYGPTVERLRPLGLPHSVENPDARPDAVLCGEMFGLGTLRHRRIETGGWSTPKPVHKRHRGYTRGWRHGVYRDGPYVAIYGKGGGKATVAEAQEAMRIDWTDQWSELVEMIPPAYARWIGERFLETC